MLWKNISTFKYFIKHINNTVKNEPHKTTTENEPPKNIKNEPHKTATENKPINEAISGAPQISKEN